LLSRNPKVGSFEARKGEENKYGSGERRRELCYSCAGVDARASWVDYLLWGNFKAGFGTLGFPEEANSRGPEAGEERNGSAHAVKAGSYYHREKRKQYRKGKNR